MSVVNYWYMYACFWNLLCVYFRKLLQFIPAHTTIHITVCMVHMRVSTVGPSWFTLWYKILHLINTMSYNCVHCTCVAPGLHCDKRALYSSLVIWQLLTFADYRSPDSVTFCVQNLIQYSSVVTHTHTQLDAGLKVLRWLSSLVELLILDIVLQQFTH